MKRNFTLIIIFIALSLFAQLDMTLAEFEKSLSPDERLEIEIFTTHKNIKVIMEDEYPDITAISQNDSIINYEHWFDDLTSFQEMKKEINQFGNWSEASPIMMEISEIEFNMSQEYFLAYNAQKFVSSDSNAYAYLLQCQNPDYSPQSWIIIRSIEYFELMRELLLSHANVPFAVHNLPIGYHTDSNELLEDYFEIWVEESNPLPQTDIDQFQITKDVYEIYKDIYNPYNIDRIAQQPPSVKKHFKNNGTKIRTLNKMYNKVKYFIIQNKLIVEVTDEFVEKFYSINKSVFLDFTIEDFRPEINNKKINIVYQTEERKNELFNFLGVQRNTVGTSGLAFGSVDREESYKREQYLDNMVVITRGWEGWDLVTCPYIIKIVFNRNLDYAEVHFAIHSEGGVAKYKKLNDKWQLESSILNWLE